MRIFLITTVMFLFSTLGYATGLDEKKEWSVDSEGNLLFMRIIENLDMTKEEIFVKSMSFFANNYKDASKVIQQQDKEAGIIIGKGYFDGIYKSSMYMLGYTSIYNAYHILQIDMKDNRARVQIKVRNYDVKSYKGVYLDSSYAESVILKYPFSDKKKKKKEMELSNALCYRCILLLDAVESFLKKEGTIKNGSNNDDW